MIITIANHKGGVGKSTTAIHLAHFFHSESKPALLVDGDANRSLMKWTAGGNLPFKTVDERALARHLPGAANVIIDTQARESRDDLRVLADGCDLLVIPTSPNALSLNALMLVIEDLNSIGMERFKILLTIVPPAPSRAGEDARRSLKKAGLPLFAGQIRRFVAFEKAALEGVTVDQVDDPRAAEAWSDYAAIGKEILKGKL